MLDDRVGVRRHRDRGPTPEAPDHRIVVAQRRRPRRGSPLHHRRRPRVAAEDLAGGGAPVPHRSLPGQVLRWQVDLREHHVHDPVEDLLLAGHVVVDRHRLHAEGGGEAGHDQRRGEQQQQRPSAATAHATAWTVTRRGPFRGTPHAGPPWAGTVLGRRPGRRSAGGRVRAGRGGGGVRAGQGGGVRTGRGGGGPHDIGRRGTTPRRRRDSPVS